ncbi:MAG: hypothetical protein SV186_04290 [Candidatus Nanohaloarchaea archaeon]|nr:hypothetical protein [Candidatus Nanohaloarchaea archaeon]
MSSDPLRGGEELYYQRLLGDAHRALTGSLYVKGGAWKIQSGNTFTLERFRRKYGEIEDDAETYASMLDADDMAKDPVRDVQKALVFGWYDGDRRFGLSEESSEDYLLDDDFYAEATDGGDIDAFFAIPEDDTSMEGWYRATVDTLEDWGYDEPEAMLQTLADEVRHEPDEDDGLLSRFLG